jgi:hypothetical protein
MMDLLVKMAEELRGGLGGALSLAPLGNRVRGAILEIDRYWFNWAASRQLKGRFTLSRGLRTLADSVARLALYKELQWNFEEHPADWWSHCRNMGYDLSAKSPVAIRVVLKESLEGSMSRLPRHYQGHPILYEVRPPIVATTALLGVTRALRLTGQSEAVSVGRSDPRTSGTLGGFLADPSTGMKYLVSCAHVLGPKGSHVYTPGPHENRGSSPIGMVRFSEIPPVISPNADCNQAAVPGAGRVDVAVAEWAPAMSRAAASLNSAPTANLLRRVAKMSSYQRVTFTGKESGRVNARLGGVTLWHPVETEEIGDGPAGDRCFGTIFEMTDAGDDRYEVAQPGDSGAWVFDEVDGMRCWNGMLIGRQGKRAYGCYAEHILDAIARDGRFAAPPAIHW